MGITPIRGLSSFDTVAVQPMNYAVDNDADFSDVYNTEATKGGASVTGTAPVQYPNAQVSEVKESQLIDPTEMLEERKRTASAYNDIASQFTNNTGYGMNGIGSNYNMEGVRFDAFA
ncbi:MAG: hypothetical protein K6E79_07750 [Pseudobutyrivibrio sp.]|nr:hypothetical protein [Pseudobutyrivibrio sp.]